MPPPADHLGAGGMLGPTQGVDQDARPVSTRVGAEKFGNPRHLLGRTAAYLSNRLRSIAREVAFQDLEDTTGVLQGRVAYRLALEVGCHVRSRGGTRASPAVHGIAVDSLGVLPPIPQRSGRAGPIVLRSAVRAVLVALRTFIAPASAHDVVDAGLRIEAAEQTVQVFGVLEALLDQGRRIGVMQDVFLEPAVIGEDVVNNSAEKRDIRTRPYWNIEVAVRRRSRKMRVDVDQCSASILGLHGPSETHGVGLGHVRSHEQDAIAIRQILLVIGGRAAAERGAQTGHRGGVSSSRLILD
jgi:hypothetical protein